VKRIIADSFNDHRGSKYLSCYTSKAGQVIQSQTAGMPRKAPRIISFIRSAAAVIFVMLAISSSISPEQEDGGA
jgi:hypothetical protein